MFCLRQYEKGVTNMRNDDIERVIDILKEQIPLSMKAHVKRFIYMVHVQEEISRKIQILMSQF